MFSALRARVGIFSLARTPLRVHSATQQNGYPIKSVRYMKPGFRPRVLLAQLAVLGVSWLIFESIVFSPLNEAVLELGEIPEEAGVEHGDDTENAESIFIPFPLTTKLVQPPPYRVTDSEWQEFIKLSKDEALVKRLRDDLAALVEVAIRASPALRNRCGKEIGLSRYWLDVDFPGSPPPQFIRSGVEISGNEMSWETMPVESLTAFRIQQALWPSAVTQSLWAFFKVLIEQDTTNFARWLGLRTKSPPPFEEILAKQTELFPKVDKNSPRVKGAQARSTATTEALGEDQRTDPNSTLSKYSHKRPDGVAGAAQPESTSNIIPAFMKTHIQGPLSAFKTTLESSWRPAPSLPPRGCVHVSGLVQLDSPRASLVVDVRAAWDPKTRAYDPRCVVLILRRFQMKVAGP